MNKLCPIEHDDEDSNEQLVVYLRHDATQEWKKMEHELGMRFSSTVELKSSYNNYVVAYGYDLYHEKNDKDVLLVKCCKEKNPQCPFRQ